MQHSLPDICVAGGGSWGTALAHHLATCGLKAALWLRDGAVARAINEEHRNPRYVSSHRLHPALRATANPAVLGAPLVVLAVPCQQLRGWLTAHRAHFCAEPVFIDASKGLEVGSLASPGRMVAEIAGAGARYAVLSGPSFADEVLRGLPTAVVLACADEALGVRLRDAFSGPTFRCYSSTDVIGVELGGALKNVIAIATGMCDGLGFGHNSRAALITRGLAEISRIGQACGARAATFMGLSGLGDLTLTCTGDLSRNRQVGLRLGRGETLADITKDLGMVAEGVATADAACMLAQRLGVDAPIAAAVRAIVREGRSPADEVRRLMARELREE